MLNLNQFDDAYSKAKVNKGLPDGKYQAEIISCKLGASDRGKDTVGLSWKLKVLSGEHEGSVISKWDTFSNDRMQYVKQDLETCGLELARFSDLESHLGKLIGVRLNVTLKTNKAGYPNTYFNDKLKGRGGETVCDTEYIPPASSGPKEYDDVPF